MKKFRSYRDLISADGVAPLTFLEWLIGRLAGKLEVRAATMATRRGDHTSLNHVMLAIWAGNQRGHQHPAAQLAPQDLSAAIREGRVRIVVDPRQ